MKTAQALQRAQTRQRNSGAGESTLTVVVALAVNASIAVMKAVAGLLTGSAAMLAEAAHSVANTSTEGLLLAALRHSERLADRTHPFGYGKVRFFTMLTGTDKVLLCARVDFAASLSADEVEHVCVRIDDELRREFTDLDEIFIEPVPRNDPALRVRVVNRYGAVLHDLRPHLAPPVS